MKNSAGTRNAIHARKRTVSAPHGEAYRALASRKCVDDMGHVTPESFCLYYRGGSRFQMTLSLQLAVIQQPYAIIKCKYSVRLFTQHDLS